MAGEGFTSTDVPLARAHDVALLDLDGVVYVGAQAVPHAAQSLDEARSRHGMRAAFVTNNAARPPAVVAAHLVELGIRAEPVDVVTSAQAGARVLAERVPAGSRILAVGGPGVGEALRARGMVPVASADDGPVAVIQGFGPEVGWAQLAEASLAIGRGLPWVATNLDATIPTARGRVLGNGALVAALRWASGVEPVVAGKPEPPLMVESVERTGAKRPLVVGDRLDTDIEGANRSGIAAMLVLTGVTDWPALLDAAPVTRPSYLGRDLRALLQPAPPVSVARGPRFVQARCRSAWARVPLGDPSAPAGSTVAGRVPADTGWVPGRAWPQAGSAPWDVSDEQLDVARALVAAAWAITDAGALVGGPAEVGVQQGGA